jgi:hypothetical protein
MQGLLSILEVVSKSEKPKSTRHIPKSTRQARHRRTSLTLPHHTNCYGNQCSIMSTARQPYISAKIKNEAIPNYLILEPQPQYSPASHSRLALGYQQSLQSLP